MAWREICEIEFASMKRMLETFLDIIRKESRICVFLGGACEGPNLVDVPALAGQEKICTHNDLDVFLWLPNSPFVLPNVTNLESNRTYYQHNPGNGEEMIFFYCIHYDQRTMAALNFTNATNLVVRYILNNRTVDWLGEILVVKTEESGNVLNMTKEDYKLLLKIIDHLLAHGREWNAD